MREMGTGPHPEVESVRPSGIWGPLDRTAMVSPHYMETVAGEPGRPMSDSEVADVIASFARSARWALEIGFDGIAIQDRKRVVSGKSVSVRVDLGGRRMLKTTN